MILKLIKSVKILILSITIIILNSNTYADLKSSSQKEHMALFQIPMAMFMTDVFKGLDYGYLSNTLLKTIHENFLTTTKPNQFLSEINHGCICHTQDFQTDSTNSASVQPNDPNQPPRRSYAAVVAGSSSSPVCKSGGDGDGEKPPNNDDNNNRAPEDAITINEMECTICYFEKTNLLITSCCKQKICSDCAKRLNKHCPYCRANFQPIRICPFRECISFPNPVSWLTIYNHMAQNSLSTPSQTQLSCGCYNDQPRNIIHHAMTYHTATHLTIITPTRLITCNYIGITNHRLGARIILNNQEIFFGDIYRNFILQINYSCQLCRQVFSDPLDLNIHIARHMRTFTTFFCPFNGCFFSSRDREDVIFHLIDHHQAFECPDKNCKAHFQEERSCQEHINSQHPMYISE